MTVMHSKFDLRDPSQVGEVRRFAASLSEVAKLNEVDRGKVALIVTELATNLMKYAKEGEILCRVVEHHDSTSVEVLAVDRGPGISDISKCLTDGYSTGGSSGTGLGAIQRLSTRFEIYSSVPSGTVIYSQVDSPIRQTSEPSPISWSSINLPAPGETVSGDTWRIAENQQIFSAMIIDGLGHGPIAEEVANQAAEVFEANPFLSPTTLVENLHIRLRGTRGGAIAITQIDCQTSQVKYVGIGNISGTIISHETGSRGLFSHNGILGVQYHRLQEFEYVLQVGSLMILHSDGLQTRWNLDKYPGLANRHPAIIAAVLYRDFCRGRDDTTITVMRRTR